MRRCKDGNTLSAVVVLLPLLLLVPCTPVSAANNILQNSFGTKCALLHEENSESFFLELMKRTFQKASITCETVKVTPSLEWAPTDGPSGTLNVYVSSLSEKLLMSTVNASASTHCAFVTSISDGKLDTRKNYSNVYFTNADPATEMLALLSYVFRRGAPKKMGFVYSSQAENGTSAGTSVRHEFEKRIEQLHYPSDPTFFDLGVKNAQSNLASFIANFKEGASAVFFFPPVDNTAGEIYRQLLFSSAKTTILVPSWLIPTATEQYTSTPSPSVPASNIIVSSTNPHPQDSNFPKSMAQFFKDTEVTNESLTPYSADGLKGVAAWINARAAVATLQSHTLWKEAPSQTSYFTGLFQPSMYTISGEITLGAYTPSCNVGGRMVILYSLTDLKDRNSETYYGLQSVEHATLMLKPWECHAADVSLNITSMVLAGYMQYKDVGENGIYMTAQMENTIPAAMQTATFTSSTMDSITSITNSAWERALKETSAMAIFGAAVAGIDASLSTQLLVEPVFLLPTPHQNTSHVVYLTATNEQQLGAVATWVAESATDKAVSVVFRSLSESVTGIQGAVVRIMAHAGVNVTSVKTLAASDGLSSSDLPKFGLVLLVGLIQDDFSTLHTHLQNNVDTRVVLLLDEVTQWYHQIQALHKKPLASERLFFATNLPPWVPKNNTRSNLSNSFLGVVTKSLYQSPASMRGYIAVRVLTMMNNQAKTPSALGLINSLYRQQTLMVDDLSLGPFHCSGWTFSTKKQKLECTSVSNGGAVNIYIWSLWNMLELGGAHTAGPYVVDLFGYTVGNSGETPVAPSTTNAPAAEQPENVLLFEHRKTKIIAAVVVATLVVCFVVAVVIVCVFWSRDSRDNRNAPKDKHKPVAIVFTDIESSTALWSTAPEAMSAAVGLHHKVIRRLIVKHKGYEVKTIGDSFMIALNEPFAAVQLAHDIQVKLHCANWGSNAIDDAYALISKPKGDTIPNKSPTNEWRGLRVRIGIHFGPTKVVFDKVTKGYDYYGDTVNTAARTESIGCGGQVICTLNVVEALTINDRRTVELLSLGPHQLRGVSAPVYLYELRTVAGRVFPPKTSGASTNPLVALVGGTSADGAHDSEAINSMVMQEEPPTETLSEDVTPVLDVLDVYFSPYPHTQKIKLLKKACKCFHLSYPSRKMRNSDEDYLQVLMLAVATRTLAVMKFRQGQKSDLTLSSASGASANATPQKLSDSTNSALGSGQQNAIMTSADSEVAEKNELHANAMPGQYMEGTRSREQSNSTTVMVLDNSELLALRKHSKQSSQDELRGKDHPAMPTYLNGQPGVSGQEVNPCFAEGNGLLFRIFDQATNRWAFYNDTTIFVMHIQFSISYKSAVEWGPNVFVRVTPGEGTSRYEGELVVPPLSTEILSVGHINGYKLRYSATLSNDGE
ncbi:hypothetical protein JKF63_00322 [Porcisia hertigi]|uniref:adenylate cyclase n=1 Tax=Porcisia hertigi TaxID=2761500 RepID=A0A836HYV2_9TRYP|nr:hypothetical protein JKF63_00322 [Porcisia hertigi]